MGNAPSPAKAAKLERFSGPNGSQKPRSFTPYRFVRGLSSPKVDRPRVSSLGAGGLTHVAAGYVTVILNPETSSIGNWRASDTATPRSVAEWSGVPDPLAAAQ